MPPGHTDIVAAAVSSVDTVMIPVEPLAMDLDRLRRTTELLSKTALAKDPDVYVLLTRVWLPSRKDPSAVRPLRRGGTAAIIV